MRIGDKVTFVPSGFECPKETQKQYITPSYTVTGFIVGIHRTHRFYRVRYNIGAAVLHECFKFIPANNDKIKPLRMTRWGE